MTRASLSLVLLLCCALPPVGAQVAPELVAARQLIQQSMARDSLPGLAIAVVRQDSILWEEGFAWADRESRVPVTVHTPDSSGGRQLIFYLRLRGGRLQGHVTTGPNPVYGHR